MGCLIKPEKWFLIISICFGSLFIFLTAPFQVPDETEHFSRSYALSQGSILPSFLSPDRRITADIMPVSIAKTFSQFSEIPFYPEHKVTFKDILDVSNIPLDKETTARQYYKFVTYFPVYNMPQVAGVLVGRAFDVPPVILLYLTRMCNLAVWVMLMFMAIRISPVFKWVFVLLALSPMSLFEAASCSYDAGFNAASFLFTAFLLKLILDKDFLFSNKRMLIFLSLSLLVSLGKGGAYFPLLFLPLAIPKEKFSNFKERLCVCLQPIVMMIIVWAIWIPLTRKYFLTNLNPALSIERSYERLHFMLSHPISFLQQIIHALHARLFHIAEQYIGILGWLDTVFPKIFIVFYAVVIVCVALLDKEEAIKLPFLKRMFLFFIFTLNLFIIAVNTWLVWDVDDVISIPGLQGRYLIPLGVLFFLIFYNNKLKNKWAPIIAPISCVTMLSVSCVILLQRYWIK
jgi:uncharacterized membrane protein